MSLIQMRRMVNQIFHCFFIVISPFILIEKSIHKIIQTIKMPVFLILMWNQVFLMSMNNFAMEILFYTFNLIIMLFFLLFQELFFSNQFICFSFIFPFIFLKLFQFFFKTIHSIFNPMLCPLERINFALK